LLAKASFEVYLPAWIFNELAYGALTGGISCPPQRANSLWHSYYKPTNQPNKQKTNPQNITNRLLIGWNVDKHHSRTCFLGRKVSSGRKLRW
jgi:hypothetical protein